MGGSQSHRTKCPSLQELVEATDDWHEASLVGRTTLIRRRRLADALAKLAEPLRRVVERVCLYEEGLEALERSEGWPARSAKLALKLGLAQLAADF